jgi:membrane protease YdiL (CAAX protease family)
MNALTEEFRQKPLSNFWGISLLLLLILVFQIVGNALSNFILSSAYGLSIAEVKALLIQPDYSALSINLGRWANFIQFVFYMGLPALIFTFANSTKPLHYWGNPTRLEPKFIIQSIVLGISALPVVSVLTHIMQQIPLEGNFAETAKKLVEVRQTLFENMLDMQHIGELVVCLFILALLPAFLEEYLFRGIILKVAVLQYRKPFAALFFQASVFAILHLSLYELPGIFLMGFIFGLVAYRQNHLWYNAITHFVFNGATISLHYYLNHAAHGFNSFTTDDILANGAIAIPASLLMGFSLYGLTRKTKP